MCGADVVSYNSVCPLRRKAVALNVASDAFFIAGATVQQQ